MSLTKLGKTWYDKNLVDGVIVPSEEVVSDRYSSKTNIRLKNQDIVIRNLRISDIYVPVSDDDTIHKIEAGEQYRPDLVAYKEYNNPNLAWIILSANNMKNIFEFTVGKMIRIPEITSLYSEGGILNK